MFLLDIADIYSKASYYDLALRAYEKSFLITLENASLFSGIFTHDLQMVKLHLLKGDNEIAEEILEYLYNIYRRKIPQEKKVLKLFTDRVKKREPSLVDIVNLWLQKRDR